jgi:hypothetical protein
MRPMWRWLAVMIPASATLAACANFTTDHPYVKAQGSDTKKMADVEAAARRMGVEVHWINYPRKPEP